MDMGGGRLIRSMILILLVVLIWKVWDYSALPVIETPSFKTSDSDSQHSSVPKPHPIQNNEPMNILPPPDKPEDIKPPKDKASPTLPVNIPSDGNKVSPNAKEEQKVTSGGEERPLPDNNPSGGNKVSPNVKEEQKLPASGDIKPLPDNITSGGNKLSPNAKKETKGSKQSPGLLTQDVEVYPPMRVAVFYEALCPDSRHFVMKQLTPAYHKLKDIMDVSLVPYGKATTHDRGGKVTFDCQHGPVECQANMVHACVTNVVKDKDKQMSIIHCMIDKNTQPLVIGQKCMEKYKEKWEGVENCINSDKGQSIMKHMGDMTHNLKPRVSFIPTITIDGSQDDQKHILQDLHKILCKRYKGPKPSSC